MSLIVSVSEKNMVDEKRLRTVVVVILKDVFN
jgi:hypothetical protein